MSVSSLPTPISTCHTFFTCFPSHASPLLYATDDLRGGSASFTPVATAPGTGVALSGCFCFNHVAGFRAPTRTETTGSRWQEEPHKLVFVPGGLALFRKPRQEEENTKKKSTFVLVPSLVLSHDPAHRAQSQPRPGKVLPKPAPPRRAGHPAPPGPPPTLPSDRTRLCSTARSGCGPTAARSRSREAGTRGRGSA